MALRLNKYSPIDVDKYLNHLSYLGFIYYDLQVLSHTSNLMKQEVNTLSYLVAQYVKECSGGILHSHSKANVEDLLMNYKGVPSGLLLDKKTGNYSLSKDKLSKVYDRGFAKEFISMYLDYTSTRHKSGLLASAVSNCYDTDAKSTIGHDLYKIYHKINVNGTLRTYYHDYNHQQFPKTAMQALYAPSGYVMVKGDFEQSDLKITYNMTLKDPKNVDVMYRCPDSYEGIARIVEGSDFNKERFVEERKIYKQNTLSSSYGGNTASTEQEKKIIDRVNRYLADLPVYQEFKSRILKRIETGLPLNVTTYFGNQITINEEKNPIETLHAALNAPSQTGTSEIVIACGNAIMDKFAEKGITQENGGIYLYLNRHDELVFLIKEEFIPYCYLFQECEDILVDDWMPLRIEFSYSDNYQIPNDDLNRLCKSYYREKEEIDVDALIAKAKTSEYFIPCENTLRLCISDSKTDSSTILAFYNVDSEKVTYHEIGSVDPNVVISGICKIIGAKKNDLVKKGYTAVLVYTDLVLSDKSVMSGLPLIFKTNFDASYLKRAKYLAEEKRNSL